MRKRTQYLVIPGVLICTGIALIFFLPKPKLKTFEKKPVTHQPKLTTLFLAGDVMLSRNVAAQIYKTNDFTLPFKNINDVISSADISFANLESPFNDRGDHSIEGSLVFNADPKNIEGLKAAGFDVLSTANNHSYDQGKIGIQYTLDWLKQNGIIPVGTGTDCHDGIIFETNEMRFGILAYSYTAYNDGGKSSDPMVCDWNKQSQVTTDIANMRAQVDYLIVSAHMGTEYKRTPNEFDVQGARNAIGTGADLIIGNHPHWIQTIEHYEIPIPYGKRDGWIFYAMGNLVFDQMWSTDTREGLTATVSFKDKVLDKIELNPVIIDDFCCPRWADDAETQTILKKIDLTSTVLVPHN